MPQYAYRCENCEYNFESFHSMNESLKLCEKCGNESLVKVPQLLNSYSRQKTERDLAGERVEKFIEDNRKILLDSKQELKERVLK